MKKKFKTGLVLSGGGTRGFAHLGVMAALRELGIEPGIISGVSAGAIVGAFMAAGRSPEEVLEIFKKGWFFQYTKIQLPVDGLLKLDGVKEIIDKEIPVKRIEELPIPLIICVSNLNKGLVEYRDKGPLSETVLASSSIPVLFSPVKLDRDLFVDGGLLNNIPYEPIVNDCEQLIVSNISPINPKANLKNLMQIATRTVYMSVNAKLEEVKQKASFYIEPNGIDEYDIFLRKHADKLFEMGYEATKKQFKKNPNSIT
jgi:NTE family protein